MPAEPDPTVPARGRSTRQFQAVVEALADSDHFRSAQDIHAALRARGEKIGLATVYRALQTLVDADRADALRSVGGETTYRDCSPTHHHHLVCRTCGRTVEIQGPAVERWSDEVAAQHGYAEVNHTLELFGVSPRCHQQ